MEQIEAYWENEFQETSLEILHLITDGAYGRSSLQRIRAMARAVMYSAEAKVTEIESSPEFIAFAQTAEDKYKTTGEFSVWENPRA